MKLILFCGNSKSDIPLEVGKDLLLGRASSCDVVVSEKKASREHCRLLWDGARLQLVDLGSANGTRLSGQRLVADRPRVLSHNDRIEIGDAAIVVDCPAWVAEDSVAAAAQEVAPQPAPASALQPVRAESSLSTSGAAPLPRETRRAPAARGRSAVSGFLSVAALIAVVAVGVRFFLDFQNDQAAAKELAAIQQIEASGQLEKARDLYQAFRLSHPTSDEAARAYDLGVAIDTRLSREREAATALASLEQQVMPADELARRLQSLINRYGDTSSATPLKVALGRLSERAAEERQAAYADSMDRIQSALAEGNYAYARLVLADFIATYDTSNWNKRLEDLEVDIKHGAQKGFTDLLSEVAALVEMRQFTEAVALCDSHLPHYAGTPFDVQLRTQIDTIAVKQIESFGLAVVARADKATVTTDVTSASAQARREQHAELDRLMLEGKLSDAQALLATLSAAGATPELAARQYGLSAELLLKDKLTAQINAGALSNESKAVSLKGVQSLRWILSAATPEKVSLTLLKGGKTTLWKAWSTFSAPEILAIMDLMELEPADRIGVAAFCFRNRLDNLGEESGPGQAQLVRAIKLGPELKDDAENFYAGIRGISRPADGFVAYQKDFLLTAEECGDQDLLTVVRRSLMKLDELYASVKPTAEAARLAEWATVAGIRDQALAGQRERVVTKVHDAVVATVLPIRHKRVARVKEVTDLPEKQRQLLLSLSDKLEAARKHALELIFDEAVYTYDQATGDHGEKAQPDVDDRVGAVRAIWEDPMGAARDIDPTVGILTRQVREMDAQLAIFDPALVQQEIARLGEDFDLNYLESLANKKLDIKSFAVSATDRNRYQKIQEIMEANVTEPTVASDPEREQVRILNEYRIMMGRLPVRICDQLVLCARGHSVYMANSGQFAHVIQGHPDGAGPSERAAKAGYGGGVSENIAMGMGDPMGAHLGWYNSSGHHRNMLMAGHTFLGTGNFGAHWTQNFGSSACGAVKQ